MPTYDNHWIIRYVDGELSPEELGPFETAMQTDPGLAAKVRLYRELKTVLSERLPGDPTREALTSRISDLNKQYFGQETSNMPAGSASPIRRIGTIRTIRWLTTATAAACILVALRLLWPGNNTRKIEALGQTNMIGITERGDQTDTLLQKAAVYFNQKQFEKALPLLNRAVTADSSSQLALFYRGVAAWHTGDLQLARASLQQVYDNASILQGQAALDRKSVV